MLNNLCIANLKAIGKKLLTDTVFAGDKAAPPILTFFLLLINKIKKLSEAGYEPIRTNVDATQITASDRSSIPSLMPSFVAFSCVYILVY